MRVSAMSRYSSSTCSTTSSYTSSWISKLNIAPLSTATATATVTRRTTIANRILNRKTRNLNSTIVGGPSSSSLQLIHAHVHNHYQQQHHFSTGGGDTKTKTKTNGNDNDNDNDHNDNGNDKDKESYSAANTKNDDNDDGTETQEDRDQKSLRDTIDRLQRGGGSKNKNAKDDPNSTETPNDSGAIHSVSTAFRSFTEAVGQTWTDLLESSEPRNVNKKLSDIQKAQPGRTTDDDHEAAEMYEGSTAIMVIDEDQNMSAFERIQRRLSEAPIIQDVLRKTEDIYETSGAAKAREKISHVSEDAREAWETSQNPWVYRVSSVYDTLTAESEHGMTERELRELDPDFSLERWKNDVVEVTLPNLMQLFLEGRIKELKPSLGESVYNRMAAESRVRKKEGVYVDTNVLGIMNSDIVSCNPDTVNKGSPIIVLHYMCQQINCVRKKETGEIVEGSEDDIRAYSYVVAFQREYDEEKGELNWKVVDFMLNGAIAYL